MKEGNGCLSWLTRHGCFAVYAAAMLLCGAVQLIDWYFGSEDPIWHLMFYLLFMPAFSLAYGVLGRGGWCAPLIAALLAAFVCLFLANGGVSADSFRPAGLEAALQLSVPSFLAALAGTAVRKMIKMIQKFG